MCSSSIRLRYQRVDQRILFFQKVVPSLRGPGASLGAPCSGGRMRRRATPAPSLHTTPLRTPFGNAPPGYTVRFLVLETRNLTTVLQKIGGNPLPGYTVTVGLGNPRTRVYSDEFLGSRPYAFVSTAASLPTRWTYVQ